MTLTLVAFTDRAGRQCAAGVNYDEVTLDVQELWVRGSQNGTARVAILLPATQRRTESIVDRTQQKSTDVRAEAWKMIEREEERGFVSVFAPFVIQVQL